MLHMLIRGFDLRDFIHVLEADGSQNFVAGLCRPFFYTRCLLHKIGGGRCFDYKVETAVGFNSDECRCRNAILNVCSSCVELLAKVHGLDASSTKRWPYWWCRSRFARSYENALYVYFQLMR